MKDAEKDPFDFHSIIQRLKLILDVKSDKDVAIALGLNPNSFFNRKKRGSIPMTKIVIVGNTLKVNLDWLIFGRGPMYIVEKKEQNNASRFKNPDMGLQNIEHLVGIENLSNDLYQKVSDYVKTNYEAAIVMKKEEQNNC